MNRKNAPDFEDRSFFQKFYEEYKNYMYYTAWKYTSAPEDCEDLVHDTVLRLMQNVPTLKQLSHFKTAKYISLTVRSAYLDNQRLKNKADLIFLDDAEMETVMIEQFQVDGTDRIVAAREAVRQLKKELAVRDWFLLDAKYNLNLSQEEIARLLGVAPNSVRMLLHRARVRARQILESAKEDK